MLKRLAQFLAVCVITSGCVAAAPTAEQQAQTLCSGPALTAAAATGGKSVAASFPTTAKTVLDWAAQGHSASQVAALAKIDPDSVVAFCYMDADYAGYPQPPGGHVDYTRALYIVPQGGEPIQYWVGPARPEDLVGPDKAAP